MDEDANLALLDQHLLKTNLLSRRMTDILAQLDTRLSRLDTTIAPLGIQPLTRKAANIDAILSAVFPEPTSSPSPSKTASYPISSTRTLPTSRSIPSALNGYSLEPPTLTPIHSAPGTSADGTAILTRGPDIMALGEYGGAMDVVVGDLERMWKGFVEGRGGAREAGVRDLSKLVEIGFLGMTQLFSKISKEGMGRIFDAATLLQSGAPSPPHFFSPLNTLLPLISKIRQILHPSQPTPKTETIVQPIFDQAMASFAELRGEWMRRSLGVMVGRVEEVDEGGIWEGGRGREKVRGLVGLWEVLVVVLEAETLLITTLFPNAPPPNLLPLTIAYPLALVTITLQPTLNTIKRTLSSHTFVALDLYQSLIRIQTKWEQALTKCLSMTHSTSPELQSALNGPISTLRGLAVRSFPELLVDIRTAQGSGQTSVTSDTTYSTLTYLETLPAYEKTVEGLLGRSQSERSWLMGAKETPSLVRSAGEEGGVVNLFVADVLGTLLIHLEGRSRSMRKPIGQAFLLNNRESLSKEGDKLTREVSHIRNTTASFNSDIIGPGAEAMLNKAFRDAKSQYLSEWTSLTSLLTPSNSTPRFGVSVPGSSERTHLKEAATAFFDRLTELEGVCSQFPLSRQDPEMRDRVGREVEEMVVGAYGVFVGRCSGKGMEKYLKGGVEDVGRRVMGCFR